MVMRYVCRRSGLMSKFLGSSSGSQKFEVKAIIIADITEILPGAYDVMHQSGTSINQELDDSAMLTVTCRVGGLAAAGTGSLEQQRVVVIGVRSREERTTLLTGLRYLIILCCTNYLYYRVSPNMLNAII